ncbi:MAG: hypothetical protein GY859_14320 [Desulfobacterales bacterium]|nr:hypothetical protein [Desulfobacterales bacterium]
MPEVHQKEIDTRIEEQKKTSSFDPIYLIYGEELICKTALKRILDALLPDADRRLNYEALDGADENVRDAIGRVKTFSLLGGTKVVSLLDSRIFYSKRDQTAFLDKAGKAHKKGERKKAANNLLALMSRLTLSFEDIDKANRKKSLALDAKQLENDQWIDDLIEYCKENNLAVPAPTDGARLLQHALEKGFPGGNHLIITADKVDKRHGLYKSINKAGMIVNCSVPKGERKADKDAQDVVLRERMQSILEKSGKTIAPAAYQAVKEMTGFDLRTFSNNLEKLINFVGERTSITARDVTAVLQRTRKDPIYEFTNAVTDKDIPRSLFYMNSLLDSGDISHPLQLLAGVINQVRRLLLVKGFMESSPGRVWRPGCSYNQFQSRVMPAIKEHDQAILAEVKSWEEELTPPPAAVAPGKKPKKAKKKKKKAAGPTDLVIAKNPRSPYPIYMTMKKADRFTRAHLIACLAHLQRADMQLKTSKGSPRLVMEEAIFFICSRISHQT